VIDRREWDAKVDETLHPARKLGLRRHCEGHVI
jgi:hypothetical protein